MGYYCVRRDIRGGEAMNQRRRFRGRLNRWIWAVIDAFVWFGAIHGATWLRYDFDLGPTLVGSTVLFASGAVLIHLVTGALIGPYAVGHHRGSFEETADIARTAMVTAIVLTAWALLSNPIVVPRSVPIVGGALALTAMFAARFLVRTWRARRVADGDHERRVLVFGAGDAGRRLARSMMRDADSGYWPVAFLDDDRTKRRLSIDGVRVLGTRDDIATVAARTGATALVIALPQAEAPLLRELSDRASEAGLDALTVPSVRDMIDGQLSTHDLRDVNLSDLLGRRPITLDTQAIAEQIAGRTVLVTGAGGSIGSELCRQIARFSPAKLYLLDRDESGLQATEMSLHGHGLLDGDEVLLADIRDVESLRTVFTRTKPDLVFHAAALKHLPLLESHPLEAWKTNVLGTLNVLTAASEVGVGTFVNISTDKAADPSSVLGYSKRITERLTASFARTDPGRYVSVRFGNVLGSRGSVIHLFTAQIDRGGPITITHPDVERYFMLIPEACQLVLEAGSIGQDGEVMVLEMGQPVKIADVAKTLIRMSGRKEIDIHYTGLRPGEKLSEDLFSGRDDRQPTTNELVTRVQVPPLPATAVRATVLDDHDDALRWMRVRAMSGVEADV